VIIKAISDTLLSIGIQHENEKQLELGLMVDIFIPNSSADSNGMKGTVIEIDGPTHFESYLQVK
jgi:hypothetical protein